MAKVINKYAENVILRTVNRLIDKYGHSVVLHQEREGEQPTDTPSRATFGSFKVAFGNGSIVINNNYKVRLRADTFPSPVETSDTIIINGVTLTVLTARKISPDGATTIVWELECTGGVIPADGNSAAVPVIISPADETSFYPSVSESGGLYSASFTVSSFVVLSGEIQYESTEWQVAEDAEFTTVVDSSTTSGTTWVSDTILIDPKDYYVRARHNATLGYVTEWSTPHLFSLGEIGGAPVISIVTPQLTTPAGYLVEDSTYFNIGGMYRAAVFMSGFDSPAGLTFDHIHWVVRTDSGLIWEGDSSGGYDDDLGMVFDYNQLMMPPAYYDYDGWYIKGKYVATNDVESEYSDEVMYLMD